MPEERNKLQFSMFDIYRFAIYLIHITHITNKPFLFGMSCIKRFLSSGHSQPIVVFILGGPCSGKGTQSELINKRLNYKHLSAG